MRNDTTIDGHPLARPRVPVQQTVMPFTSAGSAVASGYGVDDGSAASKGRQSFETVSLQNGGVPVSFDVNAGKCSSAAQIAAGPRRLESSPVDLSWCFTAKAHPRGTTGMAQCVELINQLRGAWIALAHNTGGTTAVLATMILEGPRADGG